MANQTCYVSGTGWLCIRMGQHSVPVFKLNDAQEREWNDANTFLSNKQENTHPVVARDALGSMLAEFMENNPLYVAPYREPVAITIRTVVNSTGCEYDLPLDTDVINAINAQVDKYSAIQRLRVDLRFSATAARNLVEWLAFHGFIDDKFLGDYVLDSVTNNTEVKIFSIPRTR